jgi:hypothetical protein
MADLFAYPLATNKALEVVPRFVGRQRRWRWWRTRKWPPRPWWRAKVVVLVAKEPRLPPLVEHYVSVVVGVQHGGVDNDVGVTAVVQRENGTLAPDLFTPLRARM